MSQFETIETDEGTLAFRRRLSATISKLTPENLQKILDLFVAMEWNRMLPPSHRIAFVPDVWWWVVVGVV